MPEGGGAVQQYILPEQPPENAYMLLSEIEQEIEKSRSIDELIYAHLHYITVAAAWLTENGNEEYVQKNLEDLKPNPTATKQKFYDIYGTPLIKALEAYYIPRIEHMWSKQYLDNLLYEKLRITRILRKHYNWKFGTEPKKTAMMRNG